jgi:hypothetical protein
MSWFESSGVEWRILRELRPTPLGEAPVVLRRAFTPPSITPDSAFAALVSASEALRANADVPQLRVNVDRGFRLARHR